MNCRGLMQCTPGGLPRLEIGTVSRARCITKYCAAEKQKGGGWFCRSPINRPPRRGLMDGAIGLGLRGFGVVSANCPNMVSAVPSGLRRMALPPSLARLGYFRLSLRDTPRRYVNGIAGQHDRQIRKRVLTGGSYRWRRFFGLL